MKKPLLLLLLLATATWLATVPACKQSPPTTRIKGRVTEYGTGTPIAGARIFLLCDQGGGSSLADSIVTDVNGQFDHIYADDDLCGSFYLLPYKEGYFIGSEIDLTSEFKELDVVLDSEAWVKIVTVPDGINNFDHIGIGGDISFGFEAWASQGIKEIVFISPGNRSVEVGWGPFSDPSMHYSDTIFLPGHDTTIFTIHY